MNFQTTSPLDSRCRAALPRFAKGALILTRKVYADVREVLLDRGLLTADFANGYLQATPRAEGYIADPSTFEI